MKSVPVSLHRWIPQLHMVTTVYGFKIHTMHAYTASGNRIILTYYTIKNSKLAPFYLVDELALLKHQTNFAEELDASLFNVLDEDYTVMAEDT